MAASDGRGVGTEPVLRPAAGRTGGQPHSGGRLTALHVRFEGMSDAAAALELAGKMAGLTVGTGATVSLLMAPFEPNGDAPAEPEAAPAAGGQASAGRERPAMELTAEPETAAAPAKAEASAGRERPGVERSPRARTCSARP